MIEIKDIEKSSQKAFQLFLKPENEPNNWTKWSGKTVLLKSLPYPESGKICFDGRVYSSELEPRENSRNWNGFSRQRLIR
jgi:hypothetical protein